MGLAKKVKTALDGTRLLILGAQVLFGFQLNGLFQEGFADLSRSTKLLNCARQALMVLSIALLTAPAMQHRLIIRSHPAREAARAIETGQCAAFDTHQFCSGFGILSEGTPTNMGVRRYSSWKKTSDRRVQ
jgi:hypothetical protein